MALFEILPQQGLLNRILVHQMKSPSILPALPNNSVSGAHLYTWPHQMLQVNLTGKSLYPLFLLINFAGKGEESALSVRFLHRIFNWKENNFSFLPAPD